MTSYYFSVLGYKIKEKNYKKTQYNIEKIEEALSVYLSLNGHYPCPAEFDKDSNHPDFARSRESCNTTDAESSDSFSTSTHSVLGRNDLKVRIGALPYKSLGLSSDLGLDGWNRPFKYAVTEVLTEKNTFDQFSGAIDVVDEKGKTLLNPQGSAQYIVLSSGENGNGARSIGAKLIEECPTKEIETENCNNDSVFVESETLNRVDRGGELTKITYDDVLFFKKFDLDQDKEGGLLYFYTGNCPTEFIELKVDNKLVVGVEVLQNKIELISPETIQRGDIRKLCFSTNYSNVFKYNITLNPENNICPEGWANIGYNIFGEKDIDLVFMVCAR